MDNANKTIKFEEIISQGINTFKYIASYFRVEWEVLFHPKKTFAKVLKNNDSLLLRKAVCFFVINILFISVVGKIFSYRLKRFPVKITLWHDLFGLSDIFLPVIRYVLGVVLFVFLLKWLTRRGKIHILLNKLFSIVSYASAIFVLFVLAKSFSNNLMSGILEDIWSSLISQTAVKFGAVSYIKTILWLVIRIFFITWWLWLIYLGLKSLGVLEKKRIKRIIILTFLLFLIIKFAIDSSSLIITHKSDLEAIKIFIAKDMHKAVSVKPPNYPKASLLAEKMSNCEFFSSYLRYVAKIEKVAYSLAFYLPLLDDNGKQIVNQALENILKQNYDEAQHILTSYLKESLYDETNANLHSKVEFERGSVTYGMKISSKKSFYEAKKYFYEFFIDDLEKAKQLRNLPDYIDKQRFINFLNIQFSNSKFTYSPVALFP